MMTSNSIPTGSTPLSSTILIREGESVDSDSTSGNTTPSCLKWASSLKVLLNDADGLNLFQEYLELEDPERYNMLKFWLACKGLSKQPSKKAHQLVKVIYTQLFLKAQLGIGEDLRRHVTRQIKEATSNNTLLPVTIFNDACKQVERVINDVMYPNFLRSDLYLSHVQKTQNIHCFSSGGYMSEGGKSPNSVLDDEFDEMPPSYSFINQPLPSVDENTELSLPLTKGSLNVTERNRHGRSSYNDSPGKYLQYGGNAKPINPYHTRSRLSHLSFNPVSRQDSELQSLSSDARTDSMSDVSYDESSMDSCFHKKIHHRQIMKQMKVNASINQDSHLNVVMIPRTARMQDNMQKMKPANPQQFAAELIQRLELVKQEEEKGERIGKKLIELEGEKFANAESTISLDPRVLADAIREKLQVDDDDEQDILDQHVSRVWNDWTPRRSPSLGTPVRPKSPPMKSYPHPLSNKISSHSGGFLPRVPHQYIGTGLSKRKNKDVYSSDSGNGTDLAEGSEHNRHTLAKSKSSDYTYHNEQLQSPNSLPGHLQNLNFVDRTWSSSRNTLTDSGVSVVSGSYPHVPSSSSQSMQHKEKLQETYHNERATLPCNLDRDGKHKYRSSCVPGSSAYSSFRSKSALPERPCNLNTVNVNANRNNNANRTQGFIPEQPSPTMQFVEQQSDKNRRRYLEDEIRRKLNKQRYGKECTNVMKTQDTARTISQLKIIRPCNDDSSFTTVVYNFSDEQVPYRSKVPGDPITLRQFKDFMPKKGHYRYFFMTACEELDMRPIQEEITDDNQFLPLWKGKVTAQIKLVD